MLLTRHPLGDLTSLVEVLLKLRHEFIVQSTRDRLHSRALSLQPHRPWWSRVGVIGGGYLADQAVTVETVLDSAPSPTSQGGANLQRVKLSFLLVQKKGLSLPRQLLRTATKRLVSMAPSYSAKDNKLIHALNKISKQNPKLVKTSDYVAPGVPEMTIRSWKMNEFKYYDIPSPFPTLARGLFTAEVEEDKRRYAHEKEHRIVVRGYDKFFNIGEVPWTTVCHPVFAHVGFAPIDQTRYSGSLLRRKPLHPTHFP